ncbi:site-specific DNA-methyltransferase [Helicobacter typhlonius]|uniref:Site-specific DNA-methyltransferase n=12 Tax=Helicobacter typhlonius TaxID=76936 RepID=A0A099UDA2_9HELI|nr:site-specific DNA-methyltransferase [Helicobacter typhlonius]TLD78282.1 site-specific DNA-methyltransferase [Helicobacter typhlonius]CUU38965.1 Type III restriction-modification system methylation subunit [Helicobacter typhlonius]
MDYKKAFYSKLEDCYLGVKIKDFHQGNIAKSGFSNLLKIKEQYFAHIKAYLDSQIEGELQSHDIYNKLYTFFDSYLNESGTPFFSDTPAYKNIYAKVYSNSKDTSLFYKTQNLYYVKSDTLYQSLTLSNEKQSYEVIFDASEYKQNADNTKNKIIFKFVNVEINDEDKAQILIKVSNQKDLFPNLNNVFKQNSNEFSEEFLKTLKQNTILKDSKIKINEEELKKIFRSYKKQSEIDFFIHKNATAFLKEQFDLWMFGYLYKESAIQEWNPEIIAHLQRIKNIAYEVIKLIGDFENELKAVWLKPKFAKKTEYVFSVDKLNPNLMDSIINDKGFEAQIKEWQELNLVDEDFNKEDLLSNDKYRYLPLDTKHFTKETKYKILSSFEDLESVLNGELIKADNFQALNSLMPKYQGKVDLIYIDPPYNAPASEIIYKNNFKDSTWLSMMENRLRLGKEFLSQRGILTCAIDENEQENLGLLLSDIFYEYEKTCVSVMHNPKGIQGGFIAQNNEFAYFLSPEKMVSNNKPIPKNKWKYDHLRNWGGESERHTAKNCFYPIYVKDSKIIGFGEVCKDDFHPTANVARDDGIIEVYPIDSNGIERKWTYARQSIESIWKNLKIERDKDGIISIKKPIVEVRFKTIWDESTYIAGDYGSKILTNILPNNEFDYPKSIHTVKDSIYLASKEDSVILDFFGGSGTTAHAVLELNREGTNRKFVLVEQGEHFYNVILPRIKKVAFSSEWKNGKLKDDKQVKPLNIAFRYYELESYEEALSHCEYVLECKEPQKVENKNNYKGKDYAKAESILDYRKSRKLIDKLHKGESVCLDMHTEYREEFDIFHTMANLMGWKIKRLFLDSKGIESCEFDNGEILNLDSIDLAKYPKLKNLIWWE